MPNDHANFKSSRSVLAMFSSSVSASSDEACEVARSSSTLAYCPVPKAPAHRHRLASAGIAYDPTNVDSVATLFFSNSAVAVSVIVPGDDGL